MIAIKTVTGLELVEDAVADRALADAQKTNATARRARPTDVPVRDDLPVGHPLRGRRALRVVPCGMPDCTLNDEGRLVAVDLKTGEPVAEETARAGDRI